MFEKSIYILLKLLPPLEIYPTEIEVPYDICTIIPTPALFMETKIK